MSGFRVALPNPDAVDSPMAKNGLYSFFSDLSFVLQLALATLEHAQNSAVLVYSELHLRVIIRLLASLFVCSSIADRKRSSGSG